jgi:alpha-tubulin suppressor-like RCC1 family protein
VLDAAGRPLADVVAVAAGGRHSLAVRADGTVLAWGANDRGQLGTGTTAPSAVPVQVRAADGAPGPLTGVVAVAADTDLSVALRQDGTVVTFGDGTAGQRGTGRWPERASTPTTVLDAGGREPLTGVAQVAADGRTVQALLADGGVVAWGEGSDGQLGGGRPRDRALPSPVRGVDGKGRLRDAVAVAAGGQHAAALLADGRVVAWGADRQGQLGDGRPDRQARPLPGVVAGERGVGELGDVVGLSAAELFTVAVLRGGTAVAWGANGAGQLGDGTSRDRALPAPVDAADRVTLLGDVERVDAGEAFVVAVLGDGTVRTWGAGGSGQLGSGGRAARALPGPVALEPGQRVLAAGTGERHLLLVVAP